MILTKDKTLYLSGITYNHYQESFWESIRAESGSGGKFMLDLGIYYKPQRFVSRNGDWSMPWPQEIPPGFEMPEYNPAFNRSFDEITDDRAKQIAELIRTKNQKFAVMYSGGIDSTIIMAALIKNLTEEELKNVTVCANPYSMIENPMFWKKFIWGKFKLLDSGVTKYDELISLGLRPITADEGDCIFGTMGFLELQQNFEYYLEKLSPKSQTYLRSIRNKMTSSDVHYSEFKDLIIEHWNIPTNKELGSSWYDKFEKNIKTSTVPIISLHDYYWWLLFNTKWVSCAIRSSVFLSDRINYKEVINDWAINWFNTPEYQQWSMVNNNNGEKIQLTATTYKMAARRYIYDLDKNDWYFYFKLKMGSLAPNVMFHQDVKDVPVELRPNARFGIDCDYNVLSIDNASVQEYIKSHMASYERDW